MGLTSFEAGYVLGVLDALGSVCLWRGEDKRPHRFGAFKYYADVKIHVGTDAELGLKVKRLVGGDLHGRRSQEGLSLAFRGRDLDHLCAVIAPYRAHLKREFSILLDYQSTRGEHRGRGGLPLSIIEKRDELISALRVARAL